MKTNFPTHEQQTAMAGAIALWLFAFTSLGDAGEPKELSVAHDEYRLHDSFLAGWEDAGNRRRRQRG